MSSDSYTFPCPACGTLLSVPRVLAGVRGPCPQCRQEITAPPAPAEPAAPDPVPPSVPPVASPPPVVPPPTVSSEPEPAPEVAPAAPPPASSPSSLPPVHPPATSTAEASPAATPLSPPLPASTVVPAPAPGAVLAKEVSAAAETPLTAGLAPEKEASPLSKPVEQTPENLTAPRLEPAPVSARDTRRAGKGKGFFSYLFGFLLLLVIAAVIIWLALTQLPGRAMREWEARAAELVNPWTQRFGFELFPSRSEPEAPLPPPQPETLAPVPAPSSTVRPALDPPAAPEPASEAPAMEPEKVTPEAAATTPPPAQPEPAEEEMKAEASPPPTLLPPLNDTATAEAATASEGNESVISPAEQEAALVEPLKVLHSFLQARTWTERLRYCLDPERIRTAFRAYYRGPRETPEKYTSVVFCGSSPLPDSPYSVHVFHVTFADLPEGFPVSIMETKDGWKVDWDAYVEFRDARLKKFLSKYQDAPATFRVRVERTHYFDSQVPDLDNKYCFRVSAPIDGHDGYVFVDKNDSIAVPKLEPYLAWGTVHHITVKLKWVKGLQKHSYVELRDVVSPSWRLPQTGADQ